GPSQRQRPAPRVTRDPSTAEVARRTRGRGQWLPAEAHPGFRKRRWRPPCPASLPPTLPKSFERHDTTHRTKAAAGKSRRPLDPKDRVMRQRVSSRYVSRSSTFSSASSPALAPPTAPATPPTTAPGGPATAPPTAAPPSAPAAPPPT